MSVYCISHEVLISGLKPSNKLNINKPKLCCKVLGTSQSIGNSPSPENSEDFCQPNCIHLYAFISSRALGKGSWQYATCWNFTFQITVHKLSCRHVWAGSNFWGRYSANWTKAITSQGNISDATAKVSFLTQKQVTLFAPNSDILLS